MNRFVVIALLVVAMSSPATADVSSMRDGDDSRGPLDIKRVLHGHETRTVLWHKVVMHKSWGAKDLSGKNEIRFQISTDREHRYDEVHALVALKDGKIRAWIFTYVEGGDYAGVGPSERIRFTRPDRRSIKIFFDESWVGSSSYAWSAGSSYRDRDGRCRNNCYDYAPGHNPDRLEHRL